MAPLLYPEMVLLTVTSSDASQMVNLSLWHNLVGLVLLLLVKSDDGPARTIRCMIFFIEILLLSFSPQ